MKSLIEFGRKVMFYARVLTGYEQRRIRSVRLAMDQQIQQAAAKKAALKKVPEQIILSEIRRLVSEMQNLNKKLDETDAAIAKHFNSVDKNVDLIMDAQLNEAQKRNKEMIKMMQQAALLEKTEAGVISDKQNADEMIKMMQQAASLEKTEAGLISDKQNADEMIKMMQQAALLEKTEAGLISDKQNADGIKDKASS